MKLPNELHEIYTKLLFDGVSPAVVVEEIVRDCATVCAEMSNSFYKDRETECAQAILARYGLTEESGKCANRCLAAISRLNGERSK